MVCVSDNFRMMYLSHLLEFKMLNCDRKRNRIALLRWFLKTWVGTFQKQLIFECRKLLLGFWLLWLFITSLPSPFRDCFKRKRWRVRFDKNTYGRCYLGDNQNLYLLLELRLKPTPLVSVEHSPLPMSWSRESLNDLVLIMLTRSAKTHKFSNPPR